MDIVTPCINICRLDTEKDRCSACLRTTFEIGRWSQMEPQERLAIVTQLIPVRRLEAEADLLGTKLRCELKERQL